MSTPTERNRLDEEESPYLRQHADNPVNWQPWDERALEAARERDVPIFLSIGYAACHWCHVMEEESFEDEAVAELLNEEFVPIKVDREERPDLDRIYQTICGMVTGQGGWPLSVWLTPEGEPFHVGTYYPRESRRGNPGFVDVLRNIVQGWDQERDAIENRAEKWTEAVRGELEDVPGGERDPDDPLVDAADAAVRGADREFGGWGSGPKFPNPSRIELLCSAWERTGEEEYRNVVDEALTPMTAGGMYDHVGGGFHRYATDRQWIVPHFEKMLYDNAELPRVCLAGLRVTGRERYETAARRTFAFVDRELGHPEGGFYATLDARSSEPPSRTEGGEPGEQEEGAFYTWTPEEVREVLDDDLADLACERYGITEEGNFEGTTVLTIAASVEELAEEHDVPEAEMEERTEAIREALFEAREERPRPRRDEKVIAGWNGLAIRAFAEGALALGEDDLAERAVEALSFVREHLWDGDGLARRYKDGDVAGDGYLEDYAFLARAALTCYEATGEVEHLDFALTLADRIVEDFYDAGEGTLYFTPETGEELIARPQEPRDQSTPSSTGTAANLLLALDGFVPGDEYLDVAEAVVETHGSEIAGDPMEHVSLALAADRLENGSTEVTVAADELPEEWRAWLADRHLPARVLARRPATEAGLESWLDELGLEEAPPIWAGREADDGPVAYVCRDYACSPPLTDPDEADEWLDEGAPL